MSRLTCIFRPETAGLSIGWLSASISLIQCVINILILANMNIITSRIVNENINLTLALSLAGIGIIIISAFFLATAILDIIASVWMVIGTIKRSHMALLPWLIHNGILLAFYIFVNTIAFIDAIISEINSDVYVAPLWIFMVIYIILGLYRWAWTLILSTFRFYRSKNEALLKSEYQTNCSLIYKAEPVAVAKYSKLSETDY